MTVRSFLPGIALLAGLLLTSCISNDSPGGPYDEYPYDPNGYTEIATDLQPVSLGTTSVGLQWKAATSPDVTGYEVSWKPLNAGDDSGSVVVNATATTITGLRFKPYEFRVASIIAGRTYDTRYRTCLWSPAERLATQAGTSEPIRIYEPDSEYGSGLIVDPRREGPRRVRIEPGAGAQLAFTFDEGANVGAFEAAWYSEENREEERSDPLVFISSEQYTSSSLDTWFADVDLNLHSLLYFATPLSHYLPLRLIGRSGEPHGMGFYLRFGDRESPLRHFARVFIRPGAGGVLLQGEAPNRYIEVEISYGLTNEPYA